jgi:hypothetical protein
MKQESNNAIELMLQKLGRSSSRVPQSSGNGASESNEVHLDADELNAYAENALPPTTRARYTEHLADCTRCRQIVSQLTQAAGLVVDSQKTPSVPGWKTFLASLLSPIVLRYAVPALGLLAVASIGFFVLRQPGSMQIAERRESPNLASQAPVTPTPSGASAGTTVDSVNKSQPHSEPPKQPQQNEQAKLADQARPQEKEEQARDKAVTRTDEVAAAAPAPAATAKAPVASPTPTAVENQKQASAEVGQNKVQAAPQNEGRQAVRGNDEPAAARRAREPSSAIAGLTSSGLRKGKTDSVAARDASKSEDAEDKKEVDRVDKDKAETTSVAGHRFRKSGSVWIDVAYSASQATTNVTRGSEQYRALIADESGIRTIAEQLQGEVIVVWKGRAYRIR